MKKIVYVASPYTEGDQFVNVRNSVLVGMQLRGLGLLPKLPLLWAFWHFIKPETYNFWHEMCLDWIPHCHAVLRLPGESEGADSEVAEAKIHGIPIFYSIREIVEWTRVDVTSP